MVRIRLTRGGSKKKPYYRIIVIDSKAKRDGRSLEIIGSYDPLKKDNQIKLDKERVQYWYSKGAQPSDTVRSLIRKEGIELTTK